MKVNKKDVDIVLSDSLMYNIYCKSHLAGHLRVYVRPEYHKVNLHYIVIYEEFKHKGIATIAMDKLLQLYKGYDICLHITEGFDEAEYFWMKYFKNKQVLDDGNGEFINCYRIKN